MSNLYRRLTLASGPLSSAYRMVRMVAIYRQPLLAIRHRLHAIPAGTPLQAYDLRGGPCLHVDPGPHDVRVINEIWSERIYELDERYRPRPGWVVLDVGAHKGIWSARAAWLMRRGALYAFEPAPRNYALLERNVPHLDELEFRARNVAVGARSGRAVLRLRPNASGQNSLYASRFSADERPATIDVEVISLADAVRSADACVDLLKLDAEGAEYEIVLDSPDEALQRIRRIVLEYDPVDPRTEAHTVAALEERLAALGFSVRRTPERSLLWAMQAG
jgi:FkbM family methyltransferase